MGATVETQLRNDNFPDQPMAVLQLWLAQAHEQAVSPNPNAMTLASVASDGRPAARVVLCKQVDIERGLLAFYTNYLSRKGQELNDGAPVACTFHWDSLGRQIRLEGLAARAADSESDAYFASRSWQSQLGAWASEQSQPIDSRKALENQLNLVAQKFSADIDSNKPPTEPIPRPEHWGGILIWVQAIELWCSGDARIHDRCRYERSLELRDDGSYLGGDWHVKRLQP